MRKGKVNDFANGVTGELAEKGSLRGLM